MKSLHFSLKLKPSDRKKLDCTHEISDRQGEIRHHCTKKHHCNEKHILYYSWKNIRLCRIDHAAISLYSCDKIDNLPSMAWKKDSCPREMGGFQNLLYVYMCIYIYICMYPQYIPIRPWFDPMFFWNPS